MGIHDGRGGYSQLEMTLLHDHLLKPFCGARRVGTRPALPLRIVRIVQTSTGVRRRTVTTRDQAVNGV